MIDIDTQSHRSRIHSHTDDETADQSEHVGEVMQPIIVQPLKDYKLTEGQDAAFFCKVAGVPKPRVCDTSLRCLLAFMRTASRV